MSCVEKARRLANYIENIPDFPYDNELDSGFAYCHIGALLADIILQAGVNYTSVVRPRVQRILMNYPDANTIEKFLVIVNREGLPKVIDWRHPDKINRLQTILIFCKEHNINNCSDLKRFLCEPKNHDVLLEIKGIGYKTLDYLMKLLNIDSVAVDRHIYSFVKLADVQTKGYQETKRVVEFAADFLNVSRKVIDKGIWNYMSQKRFLISNSRHQFSFVFPE